MGKMDRNMNNEKNLHYKSSEIKTFLEKTFFKKKSEIRNIYTS